MLFYKTYFSKQYGYDKEYYAVNYIKDRVSGYFFVFLH